MAVSFILWYSWMSIYQNTVLNKLSINPGNNVIYRIGQIRNYVDKCNISNVVFSRIFWWVNTHP